MRTVHIVIVLIEVAKEGYLLQLRNGPPEIGGANLIGAVGGKIEPGESLPEAAAREVDEETNLNPTPDELEHIGTSVTESDMKLQPVRVECEAFLYKTERRDAQVTEGETTIISFEDVPQFAEQYTTATKALFTDTLGLIKE